MPVHETLIGPDRLHEHLHDPNWCIIDCRFELTRPEAGREAYRQSHIPGARYADLEQDLSDPVTPVSGRHPLPDPRRFAALAARWGIREGVQVVAYDQANGAIAARLWWLLRALGHRAVAVLDGGIQAWQAGGYATDSTVPAPAPDAPTHLSGDWTSHVMTTEQVQRALADGSIALIDARTADRFGGENETLDPVAGHIPGAISHPFPTNLDSAQRFLAAQQLRQLWAGTLSGRSSNKVACMCGSGVTACHNLLALEIAGFSGAKLYAGSWSEWIRDPRRPVATG